MRKLTLALLIATAAVSATPVWAQATDDSDAREVRGRFRERAVQSDGPAPVAQVQEQRQRPARDVVQQSQVNGEPRGNRGNFEGRRRGGGDVIVQSQPSVVNQDVPQQGTIEVRRDRRSDDRRRDRGNRDPQLGSSQFETQGTNRDQLRQSDGRRFDREDNRRFDRGDDNRRRDVSRDGNWYRDGNGRWQRRDYAYNNKNNDNRRDDRRYRDDDRNDYRGDYGRGDSRWNRDWRKDRRYDWQGYRSANRSFYRLSPYYDPFGSRYGYQRFSIGIRIGSGFYSDRYWINDPFAYRLPYTSGQYRWVRYYDDVLLVDLRSGEVVDVIYDFFW
jgi:Nickel/cobalt transporter regulator